MDNNSPVNLNCLVFVKEEETVSQATLRIKQTHNNVVNLIGIWMWI